MLIGSRALQGLGAAFISPAALAIISTTFKEGADRAKALGVWAAIAIGGSAVGLVLGGALTQTLSWPWIFFINVPVGVAVFLSSLRLVPESKDEAAHRSFDVAGAVSVTGGLMALVYAIVQAQRDGWGSAQTIGTFVLAAALLVGFVFIELRATAPLVRLSIFRTRSLTTANLVMFLVASGLFAMFFFNSLYIQRVLGFGPLKAGLAFLPFTAGIILSAGFASNFAPKIGVRPVAVGGMLVTGIGMLLLTRLPVGGSYAADVLPALVVTSLGLGCVFLPLTLVATTGLEDEDQGLASGLFNTSQQVGGALGLAILSTFAASKTSGDHGVSKSAALVDGFHYAFAGGAIFVALALATLLALLRTPARRADRGRGGDGGGRMTATLRSDAKRNLDRLLAAASECFAEQGVDASIDEIARRAGIGHGTVFRRFPTKEALLVAVMLERLRDLTRAAEEALEDPEPGPAFERFFRRAAEVYAQNRAIVEGFERCVETEEVAALKVAVGRLVWRAQRAGALRRDVTPEDVMELVPAASRHPDVVLDGLRARRL